MFGSTSSSGENLWNQEMRPTDHFRTTRIAVYGRHGLSLIRLSGKRTRIRPTCFFSGPLLIIETCGTAFLHQRVGRPVSVREDYQNGLERLQATSLSLLRQFSFYVTTRSSKTSTIWRAMPLIPWSIDGRIISRAEMSGWSSHSWLWLSLDGLCLIAQPEITRSYSVDFFLTRRYALDGC